MSPKLPRITAGRIINILEKNGFVKTRQNGSHIIFYKDGKRDTVPFHAKEILHPKILKSILNQADLGVEHLL